MEPLSTCVIFSILLIIILGLIFLYQFNNREQYKNLVEKFFNNSVNYTNFTNENKNLNNILKSFSSLTYSPANSLKNISEYHIESENNLSSEVKDEITHVIKKVLNTINSTHKTKYKMLNIERVKIEKNILRNKQVTCIFFINELNKYSSRKVLLQYLKSGNDNDNITINYIRAVQSNENNTEHIKAYEYIGAGNEINDESIIDVKLDLLKNASSCKDERNLPLHTPSEHKLQNLKVNNTNCSIKKLPKHISRPFVNPSMFIGF